MELLEKLYKNATMGADSISNLLKDLEEKDNKIKQELEHIKEEYELFIKKSCELMEQKDIKPKEENLMIKAMSKMNIKKEVNQDNSDSAIADMVIQGISMGNIEMEKSIRGSKDKDSIKLTNEFIKVFEKEIETLKKYL